MRLFPSFRVPGLLVASALTLSAAGALGAEPVSPSAGPTAADPTPSTPAAPAPAPAAQPGQEAVAVPATPPSADTPAPAGDAAPAVAVEVPPTEETFPPAWFRIDSDGAGLQLWAGATHMLSDSIGIATDMYVLAGTGGIALDAAGAVTGGSPFSLGEFDIGPAFVAGPMTFTPMIGLQVDWVLHEAVAIVPQFYATGGPDPIYMEFWAQNYQYNAFAGKKGANTLYFRYFIDYKIGKYIGVGPEVEATLALDTAAKALFASGKTLGSLPIGANIMLPNYGKGNNFFIFAGYETQDTGNDSHFAGRLTFVRNF